MSKNIKMLEELQIADLDAGEVFSGKSSKRMVKGYTAACEFTPAINHNYIFHEHSRDMVVWFLGASDPLYVYGPLGSGKFWTGAIVQNGVHLHWGKLKTRGTIKLISNCVHNSKAKELMYRACQKILNGYSHSLFVAVSAYCKAIFQR